jgi:hypothetical protein
VVVKEALHTYKGSEELLKRTVAEEGVVLASMWFDQV